MKICLICCAGGHFFELFSLKDLFENYEHFWISLPADNIRYMLKNENVYWAFYPTMRNIKNFFKNLVFAMKIFKIEKPNVILSTGAGVAVPFIIIGRLLKIKSIYIESITRIRKISLSGYLVYPFVDKFLVQWPELAARYKKAEYHGRVL